MVIPILGVNKHPSSLVFASLQACADWMSYISESANMSGSVGNFSSPPPGFGPNQAEETPTPRAERLPEAKFTFPPPGFGPNLTEEESLTPRGAERSPEAKFTSLPSGFGPLMTFPR